MTIEMRDSGPQYRHQHPYCCGKILYPGFPTSVCQVCGQTFNTQELLDAIVTTPLLQPPQPKEPVA